MISDYAFRLPDEVRHGDNLRVVLVRFGLMETRIGLGSGRVVYLCNQPDAPTTNEALRFRSLDTHS